MILDPHLPPGWQNMSIENLPVGGNRISFSRASTAKGIEYEITASGDGWTFVLEGSEAPSARYYLSGRRVARPAAGIRMTGRKNHVLAVTAQSTRPNAARRAESSR